jgi:hypothetical protein
MTQFSIQWILSLNRLSQNRGQVQSVHFALVWTADHDIDPDHTDDFVKSLNIRSFVVLDKVSGRQIEFSGSR